MCRKNQINTSFCHDLSNYLVGLCDRQAAVCGLIQSQLTLRDACLAVCLTAGARRTAARAEPAGLDVLAPQLIQKNISLWDLHPC